jgi:hypothetical protein
MNDFNEINGSRSALGEGSFKRRDELRRAESLQRNKVKMGERLDRNIARAVRKGDARSADSFNRLKESITGQGYGGGNGITNRDDREQRVRDGAIKGARARYDIGNIGANQEDAYSGAPPEDSVTPKNRQEAVNSSATVGTRGRSIKGRDAEGNSVQNSRSGMSIEGTGLTPDNPKSSSNGGEWVDVSGRGQGGVANESVAPRSQTPQGASESSRVSVNPKRDMALGSLRAKWMNEARQNEPSAMQADYEAKNGTPSQQQAGTAGEFAYRAPEGQSFDSISSESVKPKTMSYEDAVGLRDISRTLASRNTEAPKDNFASLTTPSTIQEKPSLESANRSAALGFSLGDVKTRTRVAETMGRVDERVKKEEGEYALAEKSFDMPESEIAKLSYGVLKKRDDLAAKRAEQEKIRSTLASKAAVSFPR